MAEPTAAVPEASSVSKKWDESQDSIALKIFFEKHEKSPIKDVYTLVTDEMAKIGINRGSRAVSERFSVLSRHYQLAMEDANGPTAKQLRGKLSDAEWANRLIQLKKLNELRPVKTKEAEDKPEKSTKSSSTKKDPEVAGSQPASTSNQTPKKEKKPTVVAAVTAPKVDAPKKSSTELAGDKSPIIAPVMKHIANDQYITLSTKDDQKKSDGVKKEKSVESQPKTKDAAKVETPKKDTKANDASKPVNAKPVETSKKADNKPIETPKKVDNKPTEAPKKLDNKPTEPSKKNDESKKNDAKPVDANKKNENKPNPNTPKKADNKPVDTPKKGDNKPAEAPKKGDNKPTEAPKKADNKPVDTPKKGDNKPAETPKKKQNEQPKKPETKDAKPQTNKPNEQKKGSENQNDSQKKGEQKKVNAQPTDQNNKPKADSGDSKKRPAATPVVEEDNKRQKIAFTPTTNFRELPTDSISLEAWKHEQLMELEKYRASIEAEKDFALKKITAELTSERITRADLAREKLASDMISLLKNVLFSNTNAKTTEAELQSMMTDFHHATTEQSTAKGAAKKNGEQSK